VQTVTVGSGGAASIDFTSIPQTGTDLLVVISARNSDASIYTASNIRFNGSSASVYSEKTLRSINGTTVDTNTLTNATSLIYSLATPGANATAGTFGNATIYIPNYTGSTNKSVSTDMVTENNATSNSISIVAGIWASTAAITSITIPPAAGTFAQYSTASLYTITKGSGGATVA
jgi:hypothetical protein